MNLVAFLVISVVAIPERPVLSIRESVTGFVVDAPEKNLAKAIVKRRNRSSSVLYVPRVRLEGRRQSGEGWRARTVRRGVAIIFTYASPDARPEIGSPLGRSIEVKFPGRRSAVAPSTEPSSTPVSSEEPTKNQTKTIKRKSLTRSSLGEQPLSRRWLHVLLMVMGLCIIGVAILFWVRKKKFQQRFDESVSLLSVTNIGPQHRVALVEACGRGFLVGMTDKSLSLLSAMDGEPTVNMANPLRNQHDDLKGPPHAFERDLSDDLAGIIRLKQQRSTETIGHGAVA